MYTNYTIDQCIELGQTHKACGWSTRPGWGWSDAQYLAYYKGYCGGDEEWAKSRLVREKRFINGCKACPECGNPKPPASPLCLNCLGK